jgi:hypothetical protein
MAIEEKDDDLVMVGDGVEEGDQAAVPPVGDEDAGKGDGEGEGEGDGDGDLSADAGDERVGGGEPEGDDKSEARRVERRSRRQRQKEARDRDQRELKFLRGRNEQVERQIGELTRRQTATETATIDQRIAQLDNAMRSADDVYAKAIDANEGKDASEAMRIRDSLKDQRDSLVAHKEQASAGTPTEDYVDPALIDQVKSWSERNKWFDFGRRDEDSAIAGAIDDMLIRDGYDPRTSEYYAELDKRVARRLPHLAKKLGGKGNGEDNLGGDEHIDEDDPQDRGGQRKPGGPKFRIGGQERPLKSNEVHISRDRKEAMQEAGVWDDPVLRKNYLKRYAEWDREHAND